MAVLIHELLEEAISRPLAADALEAGPQGFLSGRLRVCGDSEV